MIFKDVFASCLEVREAEYGRYRGGRTIPVLASGDVDEGSWRVMERMEANDSMRYA
jgi:hypothetical protein